MDTIVAIATPPGEGALSVIRVSGPLARSVILRSLDLPDPEPRRAYHGWMRHPVDRSLVDEVVWVYWPGPHSYTGEDVLEISGHGGRLVPKKILEAVMAEGIRLAEPGEFTKRAFLNGRLDLVQAEAVADVIAAKTEWAWRTGVNQLKGEWSQRLHVQRDRLTDLLARVEAGIDFVEEAVPFLSPEEGLARCDQILADLRSWLQDADRGRVAREGVSVMLAGRPNVGKSSVFNALLGEDRAIVTPVAGTTRDVIEAEANFEGVWVRLSDTAGLRSSRDEIERLGVARSEALLGRADLALWVIDASVPLQPEDEAVRKRLLGSPARVVIVLNKTDLPRRVDPVALAAPSGWPVVAVSAQTGAGLEDLVAQVVAQVWSTGGGEEQPLVTNLRHIHALQGAEAALRRAREGFAEGRSEEFLSVDLRAALDAVGSIVGAVTTEDVLGRIFSTFCIGK